MKDKTAAKETPHKPLAERTEVFNTEIGERGIVICPGNWMQPRRKLRAYMVCSKANGIRELWPIEHVVLWTDVQKALAGIKR